ncbi:MAG: gliding motility-associated C-terminal domain-containing protein [Bacteroidota bacterium]
MNHNSTTSLLFLFFILLISLPETLKAQYNGNAPFAPERGGLIINEISNGPSGAGNIMEYIELVVVGNPNNPTAPVDISDYILDDNNIAQAGQGNAQGHLVFGDCYESVLPGSILVVYNAGDPNPALPLDDPEDANGDGVYIIPSNSSCINECSSNPNVTSPFYCPCEDPLAVPVGWQIGLRNAGDVVQLRDACETVIHAIHWGGVQLSNDLSSAPTQFSVTGSSQSGSVIIFDHAVDNNWNDPANYSDLGVFGNESPGLANNTSNQDFINALSNGFIGNGGIIFDCKTTDAGDILPPIETGIDRPIILCEGQNLNAFVADYTEADENAPNTNAFDFEYSFILTQNDAPAYTIVDFNASGNFDFASLAIGEYVVWGFSYIQTNGTIPLSDFLSNLVNSVEDINQYMACGYDGDIDNLDNNNEAVIVQIVAGPQPPTPFTPAIQCADENGEAIYNLDDFNDSLTNDPTLMINWYTDANGFIPATSPLIVSGTSTSLFVSLSQNGCETTPIPITFGIAQGVEIGNVTTLDETCQNAGDGAIQFSVTNGDPPYNVFINDQLNQTTSTNQIEIPGLTAGNYSIRVENNEGCNALEINQTIMAGESISLDLGPDTTIIIGQGIQINGNASFVPERVIWRPTAGVSNSTTLNPFLEPQVTTTYVVEAISLSGCSITDSITINVIGNRKVFIPNAFSPNGDAINDMFTIFADFTFFALKDFFVFDRWGSQVYSQQNGATGSDRVIPWDGTMRGQELPSGPYVYFFSLVEPGGIEITYSGTVNLIR